MIPTTRSLRSAALLAGAVLASTAFARPIVVVETDIGGDKDDQASLVRLLLHSNEIDIRAIICDRPTDQFGDNVAWNPSPGSINNGVKMAQHYINAYDQVDGNLRIHDSRYPTADAIRATVVAGYPDDNTGRDRIVAIVDGLGANEFLYYSNWGSSVRESATSTTTQKSSLERAFDRVLAERGETGLRAFVRKIRMVSLDGNSNRYQPAPNLRAGYHAIVRDESFHVETGWPEDSSGRRWYHRFMPLTSTAGGFSLLDDVSDTHGALAPLYRGAGQKEGDSWSTLYVLGLGVADLGQPSWGGPAGRYVARTTGAENARGLPFHWNEAIDTWGKRTDRDATARRFADAAQNAFRARWDWCYMNFASANHDPVPTVTVNGGNSVTMGVRRVSLAPGATVNLAATVIDPDVGDTHSYLWTYYPEAGTYGGTITLAGATSANASFTIPADAAGKQIHVYVAVTDNGSSKLNRVPDLTRFCRVVIDVTSNGATNQAPIAEAGPAITVTDADGNGSESVSLNGTASSDPDGAIVSHAWSWSGGSASGASASALFPVGSTLVTLTVTDNGSPAKTASDTVLVTVNAPQGAEPLVFDSTDTARFAYSGTWWSATLAEAQGGSAQTVANSGATATFTPGLSGAYTIETFVPSGWGRASTGVAHTVNHSAGSSTVSVDQVAAAGTWVSLGRHVLSAGSTIVVSGAVVQDADTTEERALVDAFRLTPDVAAPAAPGSVTAEAASASSIILSFTDASVDEDGFSLAYRVAGAASWTAVADEAGVAGTGTVLDVAFTGLASDTDYQFRVRSFRGTSTSAWQAAAARTLEAGSDLTLGFEGLTPDVSLGNSFVESGYLFEAFRASGATDSITPLGAPNYPDIVIRPGNAGSRIVMSPPPGVTRFELKSFESGGVFGSAVGDVLVTGRKSDGSTISVSVSFSNRSLVNTILPAGWTDLVSVTFDWNGGVSNTYGVVNKIVVR